MTKPEEKLVFLSAKLRLCPRGCCFFVDLYDQSGAELLPEAVIAFLSTLSEMITEKGLPPRRPAEPGDAPHDAPPGQPILAPAKGTPDDTVH